MELKKNKRTYEKVDKEIEKKGYTIVSAKNIEPLEESRFIVAEYLRQTFNIEEADEEKVLNNIQRYTEIDDSKANSLVSSVIEAYKSKLEMPCIIDESLGGVLQEILGKDIACQRNPNIVFQYPGSQRYSELHTDSPANSYFEIVVWAPLVDCAGTKSFYIADKEATKRLKKNYKENKYSKWRDFRDDTFKNSLELTIDFGEILIFSSTLLHGSRINRARESRWSLNTRYKNLFAPSGHKDRYTFYKIYSTSSVTEIAMEMKE